MMKRAKVFWLMGMLTGPGLLACEETRLEDTQHPMQVASSSSLTTAQATDNPAFLLAVGDTVVNLAESALLQLAEIPSPEQDLFVAHPEKLPLVQAVLNRYQARLERKTFSTPAQANDFLAAYPALNQRKKLHLKADLTLPEGSGERLYQRPILIRRRNCASCEEPSLVDYTAQEVTQLRAFSSLGKPEGYEVGDLRGVWQIYFPEQRSR